MSNQNRFLLPHQPGISSSSSSNQTNRSDSSLLSNQENEFQLSVDTNFDSYWEEEARNPHRNRIRIGRQYQATVPQLLKLGEKDSRKLEDLETLSFCPKRSAKVSNTELDHYFTVAKSLNLFASLVETRSLLGRDVTIADLNRIRRKEGLSLASVIQPNRHALTPNYSGSNQTISPQSSQQNNSIALISTIEQKSPNKYPSDANDNISNSTSANTTVALQDSQETYTPNVPLMRALSHFISLHHPCHHDNDCLIKKLLKDSPTEDESESVVSIKSGNLRGQGSLKLSRSRSSTKQQTAASKSEESESRDNMSTDQEPASSDNNASQTTSSYDWTREEVKLFSQAIEVCGKNFGSIKKEFLPSKSIRSIVEYYYIGSREPTESRKKSNQSVETPEGCSSPEKTVTNNNGGGGGGNGGSSVTQNKKDAYNSNVTSVSNPSENTKSANNDSKNDTGNSPSDSGDIEKQAHASSINQVKINQNLKQSRIVNLATEDQPKIKTIDARLSIYNFDDEIKEDSGPVPMDCPCPGAEVKPLKAKPRLPTSSSESDAGNSNVGSLNFYKDGELVLKLNACQEQQKCHWVQSGDKIPLSNQRHKRYTKRTTDRSMDPSSQNGSNTNKAVILSSNNEEDFSKNEDDDDDSKGSANSFTNIHVVAPRHKSFSASPSPKRSRAKTETATSPVQPQLPTSIDYNRLAVTNMKERNDSNLNNNNTMSAMPWFQQANSLMAFFGNISFPQAATNQFGGQVPAAVPNIVNMSSRPMDLSIEQPSPKPMQTASKSSSRSKSKQKN